MHELFTAEPVRQPMRHPTFGTIDRATPLAFRFDGRRLCGHAGDTLASALLAAGVRVVGRSFKYHRPRGILTAGSDEPNALVELRMGARREPNTRATVVPLFDGLEARSQNRWPSRAFDLGAVNSLLSPLFAAGFYYKTFMWPAAFWERVYEPVIRRAAGLGRASRQADPDTYETAHAFCDILVVGAGPAGLAAALQAGRSGARVILCDEDFVLGGRLNGERTAIGGRDGREWAREVEAEIAAMPNVRIMRRTTVFGAYDSGIMAAVEQLCDHLAETPPHLSRQRLWKIVARRTICASGATERTVSFGGNDRPGVMLASAMRTYLNRFGTLAGRRICLFTAGDDGWRTASDFAAAGIEVVAVIDARPELPVTLLDRARQIGARLLAGGRVVDTRGGHGVRCIAVRHRDGAVKWIACDALAVAGGWNPNVALTTHLGGRPRWSEAAAGFVPGDMPGWMAAAGAAAGAFTTAECLRDGFGSAARLVADLGMKPAAMQIPAGEEEPASLAPLWHVAESRSKAFVDFQHDVTSADIAIARDEGFAAPELLKRYTTLGMATDQGRTSALNGMAILAAGHGTGIAAVAAPRARPPYTPVSIGALAGAHRGRNFRPTRLTAGHDWAAGKGAVFVEAGDWLRAQYFPLPGEKDWLETVCREVRAVRSGVGFCDVSTLGKIDVQGPDAGIYLDRLYTNVFSTLPVGKARYGLMLREDGFVFDDGTAARLASDHFVVSTTTTNAARVMQHMEHARQVLWPQLDVQIVSVTEQWAQYAVAGPKSREMLAGLLGDSIDVSSDAFPYLACAEFDWEGAPARLFRLSFSGEHAYELAVPANRGEAVARALMEAGAPLGAVPYGTEAMAVMRIEKGHVAGGELTGTTTAADLGLGQLMSKKKDYIGRVLAGRSALTDPAREALVGVLAPAGTKQLRAGSLLLKRGAAAGPGERLGHVSSAAYSPTLGRWIGMALVSGGSRRHGELLRAFDPVRGGDFDVEIRSPVFVDPEGSRLHA